MEPNAHIFVYGTLKLGQCRANCWPITPVEVRPAWTFGQLYDLGPYPALLVDKSEAASVDHSFEAPRNAGARVGADILGAESRVAGELWSFRLSDLPTVLAVLDEIEETNQPGRANLYDRVPIRATIRDADQVVTALTYVYADPRRLRHIGGLVPNKLAAKGFWYAIWPQNCSW